MLAVAARETSTIKLGHFVTNPATRDPTVLAARTRRSTISPTAGW